MSDERGVPATCSAEEVRRVQELIERMGVRLDQWRRVRLLGQWQPPNNPPPAGADPFAGVPVVPWPED